jgi:atypical dual specificity phosphatase
MAAEGGHTHVRFGALDRTTAALSVATAGFAFLFLSHSEPLALAAAVVAAASTCPIGNERGTDPTLKLGALILASLALAYYGTTEGSLAPWPLTSHVFFVGVAMRAFTPRAPEEVLSTLFLGFAWVLWHDALCVPYCMFFVGCLPKLRWLGPLCLATFAMIVRGAMTGEENRATQVLVRLVWDPPLMFCIRLCAKLGLTPFCGCGDRSGNMLSVIDDGIAMSSMPLPSDLPELLGANVHRWVNPWIVRIMASIRLESVTRRRLMCNQEPALFANWPPSERCREPAGLRSGVVRCPAFHIPPSHPLFLLLLLLRVTRTRSVVNMCVEYAGPEQALRDHGIVQLRLPTLDTICPSAAQLREGVAFVAERRRLFPDKRVLIHCKGGRGRAAAMALAHFTANEGMEPEQALALMQRRRPVVEPVVLGYRQVREFLASLRGGNGPASGQGAGAQRRGGGGRE